MQNSPSLSPRLEKIANMLKPCHCLLDIGTDHAYLPVAMCMRGVCDIAIAADLSVGPLKRAEETVKRYGMTSRIDLRLGSGAEPVSPNEADAIVIAGMGGLLISELLKASPEVFSMAEQIIIQPMSSIPELRDLLYQNGYTILDEVLEKEGEKLYHILSIKQIKETKTPTKEALYFGYHLLKKQPEHFDKYIILQRLKLEQKLAGLEKASAGAEEKALNEVRLLLHKIQEINSGGEVQC